MSPAAWTFTFGLIILILFGWYWATEAGRRKRILGSVLVIFTVALCLDSMMPPQEKIQLGLDLRGGTSFLIQLVREGGKPISPSQQEQAVEVIRKRVDKFGVAEPVISPQGDDRILVQIPGLDSAKIEEARQQLQQVAKLELKLVHPQSDALIPQIEAGQAITPPGWAIQTSTEMKLGKPVEERLLIKQKAEIEGGRVESAHAYFERGYGIAFKLDDLGAKQFAELTAANVGNRLAVVLDGQVQSAPNIQAAIYGGSAVITGRFSETEALNLASVLENPLATPVRIEEQRSASASLGADSIKSGLFSGILGISLTVLCVLAYYRVAGLIANIALLLNVILLFGAMAMFNTVLTLPGIAGIILTLGVAIDANVLIYERLREEMASGKSIGAALDAAYDKAFSAIFDSNVTTLITALILFWQASGPVKGFAVTLVIGVITSMFAALIITRNLFGWAMHLGWLKQITMTNLIKATHFDFLGKRRIAMIGSAIVILGAVAVFAMRGERNFGVDFKGGDRLVMEATQQKPPVAEVRAAVRELNIGDYVVQTERSATKEFYTIRSKEDTSQQITEHLQTRFPAAGFTFGQAERVGSVVGSELARNSLIALGLGVIGILIYVTLRFEFSFAFGALVALLHDVVITVGIFALLGRELSLVIVGAILTIAGYSVNDTIVVFDRIREGIHSGRRGTIQEIMNQSINETLSRTILTGGVTLLTTVILYLFGGPVLNDFALTILIGILVGTYSSIFIAAPIVLWWSGQKGGSIRAEVKRSAAADAALKA